MALMASVTVASVLGIPQEGQTRTGGSKRSLVIAGKLKDVAKRRHLLRTFWLKWNWTRIHHDEIPLLAESLDVG
jgi:hypothetical protein